MPTPTTGRPRACTRKAATFSGATRNSWRTRGQAVRTIWKSWEKLKLEIWDRQLGRFVCLFQELRNVDLQGAAGMDELGGGLEARLADMQAMTKRVAEAVGGGAIAVSSGALMGVASYGGATLLATASTGTAISSLSGVAATNATLAWFGGGSLAAGGLGVAGGAAILGGIVAAPVLAVGGTVLAAKARKNWRLPRPTLHSTNWTPSRCGQPRRS